jgi:hypothetical protein
MLAVSSMAYAQATRTWVSGVGDDANPCSRTAPCKTFAGAISKTAPFGEIDVLDPGGFGALTITKSISIEADGLVAGVLVSGTNGFVVAAGPTDVVVLRGLTFEGLGTGLNGVRVTSAGTVRIEHCYINNFVNEGVDVEPTGTTPTTVMISDTLITGNDAASPNGFGVFLKPAGTGKVTALLDRVRLQDNTGGLRVEANAEATMRDSFITQNSGNGVIVTTAGLAAVANLETTVISDNNNGVVTSGAAATARLSNVSIFDNTANGTSAPTGTILSFENNRIAGNGANPGPITTQAQQ